MFNIKLDVLNKTPNKRMVNTIIDILSSRILFKVKIIVCMEIITPLEVLLNSFYFKNYSAYILF